MRAEAVRICFVCSGNICRSPTAEVVFTALARDAGVTDTVTASSAGTGGWHVGDDMDARSRATMRDAGYDVGSHEAQQFGDGIDFDDVDLVVALDTSHLDELAQRGASTPIVLLRDFDPQLGADEVADVADPYYGGASGFTDVLAQIERSCAGLLAAIEGRLAGQQDDRLCL